MLEPAAYVPLMLMLIPFINCKQPSPWCGARYSLGFLPFNLNSSWARGQLAAWVNRDVSRDITRDINRDVHLEMFSINISIKYVHLLSRDVPDDVQTGPASVKFLPCQPMCVNARLQVGKFTISPA